MKVSLHFLTAFALVFLYLSEVFASNKALHRQDAVDMPDDFDPLNYYNDDARKKIIAKIASTENEEKLSAIELARIFLSQREKAPYEDFVDDGIIPVLVKSLNSTNATIQWSATWTLANIAIHKPKYAKEIIEEKAIPYFLRQIHSHDVNVSVESLRAIGNIMTGSPKIRNDLHELGLLQNMIIIIRPRTNEEILKKAFWVMMIICENAVKYPFSKAQLKGITVGLGPFFYHQNPEISYYASMAMVSLTEGENQQYQIEFHEETIGEYMELLDRSDIKVQTAAFGVLSNIINGTNFETKSALEKGLLKKMPELLMHSEEAIVKDAIYVLSKIIRGSQKQTKMVFEADLMPLIIYHLARSNSLRVQSYAASAIHYASWKCTKEEISYMIDMNAICPLGKLLLKVEKTDLQLVQIILTTLNNIISKDISRNDEVYEKLAQCGCLENIVMLEYNEDDDIHVGAWSVMDPYCKGSHGTCGARKGF